MKKVIVTAANSFIGYRLCQILSKHDFDVYAIVRSKNKNNTILDSLHHVTIIYEEMKNYKNLSDIIRRQCDIGIALAWDGTRGITRNDPERQKNNYIYSMDCIESFIKIGCQMIVTAGSQAEYGLCVGREKVTEATPCNPNTEYGKYKLKLYQDALKVCKENHVRLIEPRFFSLYGPDDYEGTMIVSVISNMLQNIPCDLTQCVQLWDFLYIDDAIDALYKLIISNHTSGVYNFGSGVSRVLKEYIMMMYQLTGSHSELRFGAVPYPDTGMVNTNPSISRLRSEIEWQPQISFMEGISRVISARNARK